MPPSPTVLYQTPGDFGGTPKQLTFPSTVAPTVEAEITSPIAMSFAPEQTSLAGVGFETGAGAEVGADVVGDVGALGDVGLDWGADVGFEMGFDMGLQFEGSQPVVSASHSQYWRASSKSVPCGQAIGP